jgi:ribosomal protein S18 acetylase RimI-like enzyme
MLVEIQYLKEWKNAKIIDNKLKISEIIEIQDLKNNEQNIKEIQNFLFSQIKQEYGYGYIEEYHQDIKYLNKYYKHPERNNFFIALNEENEIVGTVGVREYDKNYEIFNGIYSKEFTASIWRLFIHKNYRGLGIGTQLVRIAEKFIEDNNYNEIYLHTHKNVEGALDFWKKLEYCVNIDTEDELKTVHMIKEYIK